jgi:hypothetical protein
MAPPSDVTLCTCVAMDWLERNRSAAWHRRTKQRSASYSNAPRRAAQRHRAMFTFGKKLHSDAQQCAAMRRIVQ